MLRRRLSSVVTQAALGLSLLRLFWPAPGVAAERLLVELDHSDGTIRHALEVPSTGEAGIAITEHG